MGRLDILFGAAAAALVVATWLPRLDGPIDLRWDAGVYYVLGTSLADGRGYRLLNEPGEIRANQYPPLLPAIIAAQQEIAGTADSTLVGKRLRFFYFLLSIGLGLATYALLRHYIGPPWALAATAICVLHTSTVFISDIGFAGLPYMLATVLFFLVLTRRKSGPSGEILAGSLAISAYLLRTTGIALLVAWIVGAVVRRGPRLAGLRLAMALPFVLGWQLYTVAVERDASYAAPAYDYQRADYLFYNVSYAHNVALRDPDHPEAGRLSPFGLAGRLGSNLLASPIHVGEAISAVRDDWRRGLERLNRLPLVGPLFPPLLLDLGLVLLGSVALAGLFRRLLVDGPVMPLYVLLYISAISLTPWTHSDRYWIPLAPMLLIGLAGLVSWAGDGLGGRGHRGVRRWGARLVMLTTAAVLVVQTTSLVKFFQQQHQAVTYNDRQGRLVSQRLFYYRDTYRALDTAIGWLRSNAPADAIVAASMPHWVYLRTGLTTVMPPFESDPAEALHLLEAVPVQYLVVDGRTGSYTRAFGLPAVRLAPERWESVYSDTAGEVEVFQRTPR